MRKKCLFTILICSIAIGLAGCQKSDSEAVSTESTETAYETYYETESLSDTEVGTETVCEHDWQDADYENPQTCSICGETQGERLLSYFEENNLTVADEPYTCTADGVIYNPDAWDDPDGQMVTDFTWTPVECYSEPDEEEGYRLVHLTLLISFQALCYDELRDYYAFNFSNFTYDWYTGRTIPGKDIIGNTDYDYSATLEIDGNTYDLYYSKENAWESDDWEYDDDGNGTKNVRCYQTYTFKVPEDYDGLVYAAAACSYYNPDESETETIDESETYALDDYTEGTVYFRFNLSN
jgi:hypothetical protein